MYSVACCTGALAGRGGAGGLHGREDFECLILRHGVDGLEVPTWMKASARTGRKGGHVFVVEAAWLQVKRAVVGVVELNCSARKEHVLLGLGDLEHEIDIAEHLRLSVGEGAPWVVRTAGAVHASVGAQTTEEPVHFLCVGVRADRFDVADGVAGHVALHARGQQDGVQCWINAQLCCGTPKEVPAGVHVLATGEYQDDCLLLFARVYALCGLAPAVQVHEARVLESCALFGEELRARLAVENRAVEQKP